MNQLSKLTRLIFPFGLTIMLFAVTAQAAVTFTTTTPTTPAAAPTAAQNVITRTITLTPSKDNTLYEDNSGSVSNGEGVYFYAGQVAFSSNVRRGVLAFDVASQIPADAVITAASLDLYVSKQSNAAVGSYNFSIHRLENDWGEGTSNTGENGGNGATATQNDATWIHTFHDSSLWTTAGGDFVITPTATSAIGGIGFYSWAGTELIADIQNWVNGTTDNYGWILIGDETQTASAKQFNTRENGNSATQPQLTITYQLTPPSDVIINGAQTGAIDTTYQFAVMVSPQSTTLPITYTWTADDQTPIVITNSNNLQNAVNYSWGTTGMKTITVTADNNFGMVTQTHTIQISAPTPPESVTLTGVEEGLINTNYAFTATVTPMATTAPITYTWTADGQAPVITTNSINLQNTINYSWATTGTKTITVTADNNFGTVTQTHLINIAEPLSTPVGVTTVTINGSMTGTINTDYDFTLTAAPLSSTLPISYSVQATDQTQLSFTAGLTQSIGFNWSQSGQKTITVTADNSHGSATNTWIITIEDEPITRWHIYLPLLTR